MDRYLFSICKFQPSLQLSLLSSTTTTTSFASIHVFLSCFRPMCNVPFIASKSCDSALPTSLQHR